MAKFSAEQFQQILAATAKAVHLPNVQRAIKGSDDGDDAVRGMPNCLKIMQLHNGLVSRTQWPALTMPRLSSTQHFHHQF
ncbi:hypothetical protein CVS40_11838 [Lucilia cuprina]|nr:hypothetical protein CVS40_11838 [Lucilia cuprina]